MSLFDKEYYQFEELEMWDWYNKNKATDSAINFLESLGFEIMTSNGRAFSDKKGNKYGYVSLGERRKVKGGEEQDEIYRRIKEINPQEDIFQIECIHNQHTPLCGDLERTAHNFINQCPSPSHYNAVSLIPGPSWINEGQDGGYTTTLYNLLMLKIKTVHETKFIDQKTLERIALERKINASCPAY